MAQAVFAALPAGSPGAAPQPGPDILVLEEIENESVLEALRSGPLSAARYGYGAIAPAEAGPFSVAALSRLPILEAKSHAVIDSGRYVGRDILELKIEVSGPALYLYACHWKSKLEGGQASEQERMEAAALVRDLVQSRLRQNPAAGIIVCGDFNENPDEYQRVGKSYPTALLPREEADSLKSANPDAQAGDSGHLLVVFKPEAKGAAALSGEPVFYSPWGESEGYSFSYRGQRERIDGFLLSGSLASGSGLHYKKFSPVNADFLLGESGDPLAWPGSGRDGYSDHLPILLVLEYGAAS